MPKVLSVNITSKIHDGDWTGSVGKTGIDKRPVIGPVKFQGNGLVGDSVLDTKVHGGYDKAVYAYANEDAIWWSQKVGREISHGGFGENLSTIDINLNHLVIGERWQVGSVILEVSEPRIPCRVFAGFWDRPNLIKEFTEARRSGAYLRIIKEGEVSAGDEIKILSIPSHGMTICDLFCAKAGDRDKIPALSAVPELSEKYKVWLSNVN